MVSIMSNSYGWYRKYRQNRRRYNLSAALLPILIVLSLVLKSVIKLKYILLILVVISLVCGVIYLLRKEDQPTQTTIDLDTMTPEMFVLYCQRLLILNGFEKVRKAATTNSGIDLLAEKEGSVFGIKCVIGTDEVDAHIIRNAIRGSKYYCCGKTVVVTNRYFTTNSIELAKKEKVLLWDRRELIDNLLQNDKNIKVLKLT